MKFLSNLNWDLELTQKWFRDIGRNEVEITINNWFLLNRISYSFGLIGRLTTGNLISTNPVIPASITWPGFTGPTPSGVPVKIKSPGSSVMNELTDSIKLGILKKVNNNYETER